MEGFTGKDELTTGRGLLLPLRWEANDFANGSGEPLVHSCLLIAVGTIGDSPFTDGEIPWDTEVGTIVMAMKHRNMTIGRADRAEEEISRGVHTTYPVVIIREVDVKINQGERKTAFRVSARYDMRSKFVEADQVIHSGLEFNTEL